LSASEFYRSLSDNEDFTEPHRTLKLDLIINSDNDVEIILTMRFWGLDEAPTELIDYLLLSDSPKIVVILRKYWKDWFF
jgi:hypothetical protein